MAAISSIGIRSLAFDTTTEHQLRNDRDDNRMECAVVKSHRLTNVQAPWRCLLLWAVIESDANCWTSWLNRWTSRWTYRKTNPCLRMLCDAVKDIWITEKWKISGNHNQQRIEFTWKDENLRDVFLVPWWFLQFLPLLAVSPTKSFKWGDQLTAAKWRTT